MITAAAPVLSEAWQPSDDGLLAATGDPANVVGQRNLSQGYLFATRIEVRQAITVTNIEYLIVGIGAALTAGQNLLAIYAGPPVNGAALIAQTVDQSANWLVYGFHAAALTAPVALAAGVYSVAAYANGTTVPTLGAGPIAAAGGFAMFPTSRSGQTATGAPYTATPPATLAGMSSNNGASIFAAFS